MTTTSSQTNDTPAPGTAPARQTYRPPAPAVGMAPDVDALWRQCMALAQADILPPGIAGSPGNIFAVALLGQQFGMPVMNAALSIHVITSKSGRKSFVLAANLWAALARRAGHKVKKGEHTAETCTVYLWRKDDPDTRHEATYTLEDANTAGLLSNDNYRKNPRAMVYARAVSTVVREAAGEVAMGFVDPYEAYAIATEDDPAPPPAAANLAEAAAARESAAAQPDATDAEVVPEPAPAGPSPEQVANLERQFTPGSDVDDGTVIDAIRDRLEYIEATVPEGEAERRSAHRTWGAIRQFFEQSTVGQHGRWEDLSYSERDDWAREFLSRQDAGPKGDMGVPDAGVRPTPEEVDTTPIAEGDDLPCPTCDGILDADGNGHEPGCSRAADGARPPEAGDWADESEEEPAATWTPTQPDPWGVDSTPPAPEPPKRKRGKKQ